MAVLDKKTASMKKRKKQPVQDNMPFELYQDVERSMDENNWEELIQIAKTFKLKGDWSSFIGYNYCQGRCTFVHELLRRANSSTIVTLLDYLLSVMGSENFRCLANENLDKSGRNCLTIAAKHCEPMLILSLILDYGFEPNHYSIRCGMSALSYVLKRKKHDLAIECITRMNRATLSDIETPFYDRDIEMFRENIINADIITPRYVEAITREFTDSGRVSIITPPVYDDVMSFHDNREHQMLKHLASQLFFRWRYHLNLIELQDVLILSIEQRLRKPIIFITTSPVHLAQHVVPDFRTKSFHAMLSHSYTSRDEKRDAEVVRRLSFRFANKLKRRIWGRNQSKHTKQTRAIAHLVECDERKVQQAVLHEGRIEIPHFEALDNTAYLVTCMEDQWEGGHGEMLLADLYDYFKIEVDIKATLYGKGRPCMKCYMYLKQSNVDTYNSNPGLLQLHNLENMEDHKDRVEYLDMVYKLPSHITRRIESDREYVCPDYDTESDSDIEYPYRDSASSRSSSSKKSTAQSTPESSASNFEYPLRNNKKGNGLTHLEDSGSISTLVESSESSPRIEMTPSNDSSTN